MSKPRAGTGFAGHPVAAGGQETERTDPASVSAGGGLGVNSAHLVDSMDLSAVASTTTAVTETSTPTSPTLDLQVIVGGLFHPPLDSDESRRWSGEGGRP